MILKGRVVAISGASRGLGAAIAEACAREGADLMLGARDVAALEGVRKRVAGLAPGIRVEARGLDVANEGSVSAFVADTRAVLGRCDALVNNAGVYGPKGKLEDVAWQEWEQALRINLSGVVLMCRAFAPLLKASDRGKLVNLSGGGATAPLPRLSAYAASKAAVVRLTETLALEWAEHGIDCNSVAPGALNTGLLDEVLEAGPEKVGQAFYDKAKKQKQDGGTPLAVGAELCAWLASRQSDGISGRLISAVWDPWRSLPERQAELAASDIYTLRRIVPADRGLDWGGPR